MPKLSSILHSFIDNLYNYIAVYPVKPLSVRLGQNKNHCRLCSVICYLLLFRFSSTEDKELAMCFDMLLVIIILIIISF
jgi:hypothetical protein